MQTCRTGDPRRERMRMNLRVRYDRDIAVVGKHALVEVVSEIVAGESLWMMGHNLLEESTTK